jgi:hypothetical protein
MLRARLRAGLRAPGVVMTAPIARNCARTLTPELPVPGTVLVGTDRPVLHRLWAIRTTVHRARTGSGVRAAGIHSGGMEIPEAVRTCAAAQHGVLTRRQLLDLGVDPGQIRGTWAALGVGCCQA